MCTVQVGVPSLVVFLNKCDVVADPELQVCLKPGRCTGWAKGAY